MNLGQLASKHPNAKVRLLFRNDNGATGTLETTAGHAADPNLSQRFFPPNGETAATMGWGMPWWYAEECYKIIILEEVQSY